MTTVDDVMYRIADFDLGTQAQKSCATTLRYNYVAKLLDRGFELEDVKLLISVRVTAKWWMDNKEKLGVMNFKTQLSSCKGLVTRYGSIENAANAQIEAFKKQIDGSRSYHILSQPMFKYSS